MEVNTLKFNNRTLNSGQIFFDDCLKANKWKEGIKPLHIGCSEIIFISEGKKYYGFKMFYTKNCILELAKQLKEVLS